MITDRAVKAKGVLLSLPDVTKKIKKIYKKLKKNYISHFEDHTVLQTEETPCSFS